MRQATKHGRPMRLGWAKLLKRVFNLYLEHCPNCGGELKVIAAILERPAIEKILTHLEQFLTITIWQTRLSVAK
jgi:hypothetical protein